MGALTLAEFMRQNPDGVLEEIAKQFGTTLLSVVKCIPGHVIVAGDHFDAVWNEVTTWGAVTTLLNTSDVILEFCGDLPTGFYQRGYFNLSKRNGLSGHIKAQSCQLIGMVERKFMGMDTASLIFFNAEGNGMLKIYLGRDDQRNLMAAQLAAFRSLAMSFEPALK